MIQIVGCNHGIQPRDEDPFGDTPDAKDQKSHFASLIDQIVQMRSIQFVGKEWGLQETSAARALAGRTNIRWANINTSLDDFDRLGIPHGYANANISPEEKGHWNSVREKYMAEKLLKESGGAPHVLVICGFDHMNPLAELLRKKGFNVETVD